MYVKYLQHSCIIKMDHVIDRTVNKVAQQQATPFRKQIRDLDGASAKQELALLQSRRISSYDASTDHMRRGTGQMEQKMPCKVVKGHASN